DATAPGAHTHGRPPESGACPSPGRSASTADSVRATAARSRLIVIADGDRRRPPLKVEGNITVVQPRALAALDDLPGPAQHGIEHICPKVYPQRAAQGENVCGRYLDRVLARIVVGNRQCGHVVLKVNAP